MKEPINREERTMKTWKITGLAGLMMAMAGSAWGVDYPITVADEGYYKLVLTSPNVAVYTLRNQNDNYNRVCLGPEGHSCRLVFYNQDQGVVVQTSNVFRSQMDAESVTASLEYDTIYESHLRYTPTTRSGGTWSLATFRTHANPTDPEPPEPETPTPPEPEPETPEPEPETPEPGTPEPEPETPEPGTPDPEPETPEPDAGPVEPRCDHIAIVPGMPRAMSGDEGTPDHWLRITNPYGEGINFVIEGRDEAGTKFGTYRRELPAYRSVRVKMRDIEAAFDAAKPAGWWTLTVTGSGTVHVIATTKQGDVRIPLPVVQPEVCESR